MFVNNTKMSNAMGLHLPDGMKLKGEENYQQWKEKIMNIVKSNQLARYINDKCVPPPEIDKFDPKADQDALKLQITFQASNTNIQLAITTNYKAIPAQVC